MPLRVRRWGYRVLWLGTPAVVYARTKGWIGDPELVVWGGYCTLFGVTADANVRDPEA